MILWHCEYWLLRLKHGTVALCLIVIRVDVWFYSTVESVNRVDTWCHHCVWLIGKF